MEGTTNPVCKVGKAQATSRQMSALRGRLRYGARSLGTEPLFKKFYPIRISCSSFTPRSNDRIRSLQTETAFCIVMVRRSLTNMKRFGRKSPDSSYLTCAVLRMWKHAAIKAFFAADLLPPPLPS